MAEYTDTLRLRKPQHSDNVNPTLDVGYNMDIIDGLVGAVPYTVSTRPDNPQDGLFVYEEDTDLLLIWDATAGEWIVLGTKSPPRGKMVLTTSTTAGSDFSSGENGPYLSSTFTAVASRRYVIDLQFYTQHVDGPAPGIAINARVRWATGASVTTSGTQLALWNASVPHYMPGYRDHYKQLEFVPAIDGQVTVGLTLNRSTVTSLVRFYASPFRAGKLLVRDWGPA